MTKKLKNICDFIYTWQNKSQILKEERIWERFGNCESKF